MIQLVRPCRGHITQFYGNVQPDGYKHTGNDYAFYSAGQVMPEVFAAADGTVLYAGDSRALGWPNPWYFNPDFDRTDAVDSSAGNVVVLGHVQNGVPFVTTSSHLEAWSVNKGDTVRAGQRIATIGETGRAAGKHLHFELMFKPFTFNTATYGRSDPNPYIIEGLAAQGSITEEDDFMALFNTVEEFKAAVAAVVEPMHATTRKATAYNVLREEVPYLDPNTGKPAGTTSLLSMAGAADLQHVASRKAVADSARALVDSVRASAGPEAAKAAEDAYNTFLSKLAAINLTITAGDK